MCLSWVWSSHAFLTGAAILVGHVDVDVRGEGEHGADDIIAALPGSPHEGRPALQVWLVFHGRVRQKHTDGLLQVQRKTTAVYTNSGDWTQDTSSNKGKHFQWEMDIFAKLCMEQTHLKLFWLKYQKTVCETHSVVALSSIMQRCRSLTVGRNCPWCVSLQQQMDNFCMPWKISFNNRRTWS